MAVQPRRAVITGIGVLSPIGIDLAGYWQSLIDGKTGIRPMRHPDVADLPCRIAGDVPQFNDKFARNVFKHNRDHAKSLKVMARTVQLGVCAAQFAMNDAGMEKGKIDPTRIGVEFGSAMIHTELDDISRASRVSTNCQPGSVSLAAWGKTGLEEIPPLWMLKYLPNMPACHVSIMHDIQGPSNTITVGDSASLIALGEAYRILNRDLVDFVLVGGTESKLNTLNYARQMLFQPLTTTRNETPQKALRPFDRDRDGTVLGEGAAGFGLEELEHAQRRGAKIYAELVGYASGFDSKRDGRVIAKVMRRAIEEAGITPDQIDHVNAHGLGTKESDAWEARAIRDVFGKRVPIWGLKSYLAALGPGGSLIELLGSVLALQHGQLPGTLNCDNPDPECGIQVNNAGIRPVTKPYALKLSFTEMGQTAAVVIRKWEG